MTENSDIMEPVAQSCRTPVTTGTLIHGRLTPSTVTVETMPSETPRIMTVGVSGDTKGLLNVVCRAVTSCGMLFDRNQRTHVTVHDTKVSSAASPWLMLPMAMAMLERERRLTLEGFPRIFAFGALDQYGRILPVGDVRGMLRLARLAKCPVVVAPWGTPDILGSRVYRCARLRDVCRLLTPPVKEAA